MAKPASELPQATDPEKPKGSFPQAVTTMLIVLLLVWVAAFFIPSGKYQLDASGSPIAGSYQ